MKIAELRAFEILLAVKQEGSYAAAARALGLTRAAVSRSIHEAEQRYNIRLTKRTTREVALTPLAEDILSRMAKPLEDIRSVLSTIEDTRDDLSGQIRLSCSHAFGRYRLLPLLTRFSRHYPLVSFELNLDDKLENLVTSPTDLVIRIGEPHAQNIIARQLCTLNLGLYGGAKFAHINTLEDLAAAPKIAFRIPGTQALFQWQFTTPSGEITDVPTVPHQFLVDSVETVVDLLLGGAGVAIISPYLFKDALADGKLVELLPDHRVEPVPCYLCYYHREHIPQRVRVLIEFLVENFPEAI